LDFFNFGALLHLANLDLLTTRRKLLEVIVTSHEEAAAAEEGGADRLEVVRSPEDGGLTPDIGVVEQILNTVSIPVRVMVRERDSMSIGDGEELLRLQNSAQAFAALPIDGLVLGFLNGSEIDGNSLRAVLSVAPGCRGTFHRAFESVRSPQASIAVLKQSPQIDRILVRLGGNGETSQIRNLVQWQEAAAPEIKLIVGIGLEKNNISHLKHETGLSEIHIGRMVREPETAWGRLSRDKVAALKSALG
jgi:copper homeostasis protein